MERDAVARRRWDESATIALVSDGFQEREEMCAVSGRDDVCVAKEHATRYRAEGSADRWEGNEEVATLCPREREGPRLLKDLVVQLYWEGDRARVTGHSEVS